MCHISHSYSLSRDPTVPANGGRRAIAASRMESLRHCPRSIPAQTHDAGRVGAGHAWIYQRLFSHASIWRRRPEDWRAVPLYLAMSYLYKRSNRFWHQLIKHDLVHTVCAGGTDAVAARLLSAKTCSGPEKRFTVPDRWFPPVSSGALAPNGKGRLRAAFSLF